MASREATIDMMWGWTGYGYDWVGGMVGTLVTLLLLAGLAALVIWAVALFSGRRSGADQAEGILRRRLAAREITEQEYRYLLQVLHSRA